MKAFLPFGFTFLARTIVPGVVGAAAVTPLLVFLAVKIGASPTSAGGVYFLVLSIGIGLLITLLDEIVYRTFEGYSFWPLRLRKVLVERLNNKIRKRYLRYLEARDPIQKQLLWEWLTRFPCKENRSVKDEMPVALLPTRLGNLLATYESYPKSRYNISGVFFWPRFWLALDTETRKEINTIWAEGDCVTYVSFILLLTSPFYFIAALFDFFEIPTVILGLEINPFIFNGIHLPAAATPFLLLCCGIFLALFSYGFYILSLPLHSKNGDYFQAVFDLWRADLRERLATEESESVFWGQAWARLKYGLTACKKCGKYYPAEMSECPECLTEVSTKSRSGGAES